MQRRHHYEQAFEAYLRRRRVPYVAVDEARKALLPDARCLREHDTPGSPALKSFDFVIYGEGSNLLVECKGRRIMPRRRSLTPDAPVRTTPRGRLECWVTADDIESLERWEHLFGPSFEPVFLFIYWCDELPPDALFEEIFEHAGRWYALRATRVRDYKRVMKVRSARWRTFDVPPAAFDRISGPLTPPAPYPLPAHRGVHLPLGGEDGPPLPTLDALAGPP